MSENEMALSAYGQKAFINTKLLGVFGIICAPMLLVEMITRAFMAEPEKLNDQFVGFLGVFYIGGWIATAVGIRQSRALGRGVGSKIVSFVQITGLILAFLFSIEQFLGLWAKNSDSLLFTMTDIAYPFSHVFMIVIGIFVWRAGVWRGISVVAPFLVGFSLLVFFPASSVIGIKAGGVCFSFFAALGLALAANAVRATTVDFFSVTD
ncbi:MAG TPA: hypothetical protein VGC76_05520 [Pyrinomonadaceae bacterium]|jgi:hypothetical protein